MRPAVYLRVLASACLALLAGCAPASGALSPNNEYHAPRARPHGWVIVIHGGGWETVGKAAVTDEDGAAEFFEQHGWGTYNVDYRAGPASLGDVLSAYDWLRRRVGARTPICAWGSSAGGNLALLLAAWRPGLACVISEAGPVDLISWPRQPAWAPPGVSPYVGPRYAYEHFMLPALGAHNLRRFSPVYRAGRIRARLLLGCSTWDYWCPPAQPLELGRALPRQTTVMFLAGAPPTRSPNFTHANVTRAALMRWRRAELQVLSTLVAHARSGLRRQGLRVPAA